MHLEIFGFFSPARDDHERGFTTAQEVSDWAATSRFINPHPAVRSLKFKGERKMHNKFLDHDSLITSAGPKKHLDAHTTLALLCKRKEFDDAARAKYLFRKATKVFSRNLVKGWTDLGYLVDVKAVTDAMRARVLVGIEDRKLEGRDGQVER